MVRDDFIKLSISCFIGVLMGIAICGEVSAAEKIKIGFAGPLSGELSSYGISALRGVELAVKDINSKGGIAGRLVELLVEDDLCKPKDASIKAGKLVAKGAQIVVGHICSGATKAAVNIYHDAKIITVSPSATNPDLTRSGDYPNFYRTIAPDDVQAQVQVDFALNVLKLKKIAVFHDKSVYGEGLAGFVKDFLEKSDRAEMVLYEGIPPGTIDYTPLLQKIMRKGAEVVIFGGYHPQASKIVRQLRRKKMETIFIAGDGIKVKAFIASTRRYAENVYATAPKDTSEIPRAIAAAASHRKEYGSVHGTFFLNAYTAALAAAHAIEKAGSTDYDAVSTALKSEFVETPLGKVSFDEHGDAIGTWLGFSVYRVKEGVFVKIK
jgi:branched-chain amino acid transport system substrate-binding protein